MVRTSRCFEPEFSQLGGPDTLEGVERLRCNLPFADFSFAFFRLYCAAKVIAVSCNLEGASKFTVDDPKGEGAASLAAGV